MNLRFLETLVWLAQLRNFRMTAEKLHTTQAAVSSRIATLEQDFGVRLFDRGAREVTLTQEGSKVLDYAQRILKLSQDMRRAVDDRSMISGTIRLGVIEVIVHSWLPILLERMSEVYPKLAVELTSDTTLRLSELLTKGSVDVTLQSEPVVGASIANLELGSFPMRWIASPSMGISDEHFDLIDLASFPILSFSRDSRPHRAVERLLARLPTGSAHINWITSVAAIIRLTVDGFGIAAVPPAVIRRELADDSVRFLNVNDEFPDLPLVACHRTGPDNPVFEAVATLAQQVATEFALASGPQIALPPNTP
jgi:DNA-binding transcriptional LysR family regulator